MRAAVNNFEYGFDTDCFTETEAVARARHIRNMKRRRALQRRRSRRIMLLIAGAALILIIALGAALNSSKAKSDRAMYLTSVCVEEGDCIWNIAKKYYTEECGSMSEYVREIKATNGLTDDVIKYGYSLLIPYYE
ncbi:MAG: LysM peptidoglycan-binding domain-containing protein [Lachnospiraceae bacterium]|nr:LysM peptidoglycan-binding domain-containing protein [Lachnospiraceae bacterium]